MKNKFCQFKNQLYICRVISQSFVLDKKEEILKAALKLFVELGFHATPTSKIAKEAGVANGTLFHYFKTKEELILALYIDIKTRLNKAIYSEINVDNPNQAMFKAMYFNTLTWSLGNRAEFYFIQQFLSSPFQNLVSIEEVAKQTKPHFDLFESGIKKKVLKALPVDLVYIMVNSHIAGIHSYLSSNEFPEAKQKKIMNDSFDMLWDMIT